MLERDIERHLKKMCENENALCLKFTSPSKAGVPDRIIMTDEGRIFFVELKAPGGKPRALQRKVFKEFKEHGHEVFVLDSIEKVDLFISDFVRVGDAL